MKSDKLAEEVKRKETKVVEEEKMKEIHTFKSRRMKSGKLEEEEVKRKETEEEEVEMKKFYALVENIRATRNLWEAAPRKMQRRETLLWKPAFEWEDFSHGSSDKDGGIISCKKEKMEEGKDGCASVDLSLGL